jgi:hypothetical protein
MTIPLGEPIIVYPYEHEGCLQRMLESLLRVGAALAIFGAGLAAGYVLGAAG